ncbi:SH3 domain-containing YSC84-like protein 1 [Termitomyces sp. T112]|nr:SH3 domain-containing YSC84-like protein 1 [Termitomyces sp. T112]
MSSEYDNLDTLLRTTLLPGDPGYYELLCRRLRWWDSNRVRSWFLENGYTLYHRYQSEFVELVVEMYPLGAEPQENVFPYPYEGGSEYGYEGADEGGDGFPSFHAYTGHRVTVSFAQNRSGRHVAVKAILAGSEELRILRRLQEQGVPCSTDDFHNVIPVLDLLPYEGHWLAIMPRWGMIPLAPSLQSVHEVFHFIHCLLKGLTFLHEHRIAHGDIKTSNILVNHVDRDFLDDANRFRRLLRSQSKLIYAFCDFDGSTMFSPSMSLDECRLPSHVSFNTLADQVPADTSQGEFDFNPFAFDVGMLGVLFCQEFQYLTPTVPMLAPLLDRMTTRYIERRFKASEALQFFEEEVLPRTPKNILSSCLPQRTATGAYDTFDRWVGLDPDFVDQWTAFREPPVPLHLQYLRHICQYPWVFNTVRYAERGIQAIAFAGLFVCMSIEGTALIERKNANRDSYESSVSTEDVLTGRVPLPDVVSRLYEGC